MRERIGEQAEHAFVTSIAAGEIAVEGLDEKDWRRAAEIMARYDMIGMVDATVIAIAERLKLDTLATTDRRHFTIVRPAHVERFTLVP
jgi:predicted nucleic acid-binding protein